VAYRQTNPSLTWSQISELMSHGRIFDFIQKQTRYVEQYQITKLTISMNGEIIRAPHPFRELRNAFLEHGKRIMEDAKTQPHITERNDQGIPMDSADAPLSIAIEHQATIEGMGIAEIMRLLGSLSLSQRILNHFPVFFIDSMPREDLEAVDGPPMIVSYLFSRNVSAEIRQVFRIPRTKTVVGPLLFDHYLSRRELRYALHYVRLAFCEGLAIRTGVANRDSDLTVQQLMYIMLWRSSLRLKGVQHGEVIPGIPQNDSTDDPGPLLHWSIVIDPLSEDFRRVCN
jgi:hypothetical protein